VAFNHPSGDKKSTKSGKQAVSKAAARKTACIKSTSASTEAVGSGTAKKRVKAKQPANKAAATRKKVRSRAAEDVAIALGTEEDADPFEIAKRTVKGSVPAIVRALVEKAVDGSCTHAKTLFEMTGAKHMFGEEAEAHASGEPWAKLVLERMEQAEREGRQRAEVAPVP